MSTTYNTIVLESYISDGFLMPKTYAIYIHSANKQIVYLNPDTLVVEQVSTNSGLTALTALNKITVSSASDVTVRLISPALPTNGDLLLLTKGAAVGIYQYVSGWLYFGQVTSTGLDNAKQGTGLSTGYRTGLQYDGLVCQVSVVDADGVVPTVFLPYKVYVDTVNSIVYIPYPTANTMSTPYSVISFYSPPTVTALTNEPEVVISPCGYKQVTTLAGVERPVICYSGLVNPTIGQPLAIYNGLGQLVTTSQLMLTGNTIDYTAVQGLSESEYQLTSGYYRGGNNLWDTIVADNGVHNGATLFQITEVSTFPVCLADVKFMQATPSALAVMYLYVGKPGYITADNIMFGVKMKPLQTYMFKDIRLSQGEALFLRSDKAITYNYRYTMLARSF